MKNNYTIKPLINGGLGVWRNTTLIGIGDNETHAHKLARADRFGVPEWVPLDIAGTCYLTAHVIGAATILVALFINNTPAAIAGAAIYLHTGRYLK
jgi:hypothetical protein